VCIPGNEGNPCGLDPDSDLHCSFGICTHCGMEGESCCSVYGSCVDPGTFCTGRICTSACGKPGQPCCSWCNCCSEDFPGYICDPDHFFCRLG
jgi:hypothetical protein